MRLQCGHNIILIIKLKISRSGVRNAGASASSQKRALYRKAVSMGDGMATDQSSIWQSKESVGSNESLASNASIPLPVPVRTRSARGGSESGYSSDTYNAMTIRCHICLHYDNDTL